MVVIERDSRLEASSPTRSAWVSANAGAGKTHLLVWRVLRLLLAGTPPSHILCMTYTKAAAAEMRDRIFSRLTEWVVADDATLDRTLMKLTGEEALPALRRQARSLFALLSESPEGLRIQTIHSFCQSLLKRFPLEAGVAPYFSVIEERTANELLHDAAMQLFSASLQDRSGRLGQAMQSLAGLMSEASFRELLREIAGNRRRLREMVLDRSLAGAERDLYHLLQVSPGDTEAVYLAEYFTYTPQEAAQLRACLEKLLASDGKRDRSTAEALAWWLNLPERQVLQAEVYSAAWLRADGEKLSQTYIFSKGAGLSDDEKAALLMEQDRAQLYSEKCRALRTAHLSAALMALAHALLEAYDRLKRAHAVADYDDLITAVYRLLGQEDVAPWIMYKLDYGIDHILVDEAQDTSIEQWVIVRRLTEEFFAGQGRSEQGRTLFAVGDVKQSIFSFQGARPDAFHAMRRDFGMRVRDAMQPWTEATLEESFRSAAPVLNAVDAVFAHADLSAGGGQEAVHHRLERMGAGGLVEVWPLTQAKSGEEPEEWRPAESRVVRERPAHLLSAQIAEMIGGWLDTGEMLASRGRPIEPGDIMILVRRRGELVNALIRCLRSRGVPVAGVDRLVLGESLIVKDMLALGSFLLLPEDDLTLAALLRSPLFGISEEQLFEMAHGRGECTLWQRLEECAEQYEHCTRAHALLAGLLARADYTPPYELYAEVLEVRGARARIAARMGSSAHDVLDEFLNQALLFEQSHVPSLQGFLHWMEQGSVEIRRDLDHGRGEVRIMTVHAAKGLQAPVVILPDTSQLPKAHDRLLWHEEEERHVMLWGGKDGEECRIARALKAQRRERDLAEYRRLLYVAMTRAEDRLYICGTQSKARQGTWHQLVWEGLEPVAEKVETPAGPGLRLHASQVAPVERPVHMEEPAPPPMPEALKTPLPWEEPGLRTLSPGRIWKEDDMPASLSPGKDAAAFRRSRAVHLLLQHLPGMAPEARGEGARRLLSHYGYTRKEETEPLIREVLRIIGHPDFALFFGPHSVADVPVTGVVRLQERMFPVSGQIDRLAVTEREAWVLDYKANMLPPRRVEHTPARYVRQMAGYCSLMSRIYPGRRTRCALLWTAGPTLMVLPDAMLAAMTGTECAAVEEALG